jgi:hypothetical protein
VATTRRRSAADIRRELEAAEQRFIALYARWQATGSIRTVASDGPPQRDFFDSVEEVLRKQRGEVDRLHQLWIEYAQSSGIHAPQ